MQDNGIGLVVFDLAGTVVDHGSRAPAGAFCELFRSNGITATDAEARVPMGKHKRDHIVEMLAMPSLAAQWRDRHGRDADDADVETLFQQFLPLQLAVLPAFSQAIEGVAAVLDELRRAGIRTAATTGYNNAMTELVLQALSAQQVVFDYACCAADVAAGRPRPWMIFHCMEALDVFPPVRVVNVGDTIADVAAGVNAGAWSVGVTRTGNMLGLSREETESLPEPERDRRIAAAAAMREAGADATIESAADLPNLLAAITRCIGLGKRPGSLTRWDLDHRSVPTRDGTAERPAAVSRR